MGLRTWLDNRWDIMFDYLYKRYLLLLNENRSLRRESEVHMGELTYERSTQSDKPSWSSGLTRLEVENYLRSGYPKTKFKTFTVANTNSMEPFIDHNSIVCCEVLTSKSLDKYPLSRGDIIVFKGTPYGFNGSLVIHEIVKVYEDGDVRTKGWNNFLPDPKIKRSDILYRLQSVHNFRKYDLND